MVEDTRKTAGAGRILPLNEPVPIGATETFDRAPASVSLGDREVAVAQVRDSWLVEEEWWRDEPIVRHYYDVALADGGVTLLFRDAEGRWFRQRR